MHQPSPLLYPANDLKTFGLQVTVASVFVGTVCLSPGWVRGAAAAVCRDQCREESQHLPCPSYQSCPPAGKVSAMDNRTQWDGGAEFGTGCRRKGGQREEKGTGMCAAMLNYKPITLQQDGVKKMALQAQICPELLSGPAVLQILGRSNSPNFKKSLALNCTILIPLFPFDSDQTGKIASLRMDTCRA